MEKMTQILYDKNADVLYLSIGDPRPAISEEIGDDILLRRDLETNEVVGLTVLNLSTRDSSIQETQFLPVEVEFHLIGLATATPAIRSAYLQKQSEVASPLRRVQTSRLPDSQLRRAPLRANPRRSRNLHHPIRLLGR
jgi:uncharacterized protein YuzE